MSASSTPHVVIIGGGLAGLSAAQSLSDAVAASNQQAVASADPYRLKITLLESKRSTGGRAGSFSDSISGESVDYCQHVAMGCCTNFISLLKRFDMLDDWKRYRDLVFHYPGHSPSPFSPSRWLPAPLHLAACVGKLGYLNRNQKREVRSGMWRLMRTRSASLAQRTAKDWLQSIGQSQSTIQAFWDVILVSALGEETDVVSMQAARKVLIDGFAAAQGASDVLVPCLPLSEMFGERLPQKLESLGVELRCQAAVKRIEIASPTGPVVELVSGEELLADQVIVAVPWYRLSSLFDPDDAEVAIPNVHGCTRLDASPISGIHLWLDRPIMTNDHAVMVGTTSQWVFRQPLASTVSPSEPSEVSGHYHQVVISASSGQSQSLGKQALLDTVLDELRNEFPMGRDFKLLRHRIVTDPNSVFSVSPATESIRGNIRPALPWLHLAGDWTPTGWPSTMESAVISGRMAANSVARRLSDSLVEIPVDPGLPWGWLAKRVIRR
ncbi:15-cis-phytoene desaturase [Rubripirellula obstinata]|uniref:15-cis-phytoene desaturase n=1 Tax=Rubripirellula obstinata TaxID=406547 RepID=A0A5B1CKR8_9BACT|nr:hydroxysqualene dehydroxylase HpnE [Rubripirellula obstinata]KAA1260329.1 15-cis-phytoene desaturase [Rubripirellula obstinata]